MPGAGTGEPPQFEGETKERFDNATEKMVATARSSLLFRIVMTEAMEFYLAAFALTNAAVFLHIGTPFRRLVSGLDDQAFKRAAKDGQLRGLRKAFLGRLVRCHACFGFWVGTILALLHLGETVYGAVMAGLTASGVNFIVWVILLKMGADEL